ncbi:MAG: hypothetical protein M3Z17_09040 [Gemmatimonadota bacterium]|nr:hypothetical protein [Gemmatimonadota bacterium]
MESETGQSDAEQIESRIGRNMGVGCVTAVAGFFSGGMVGVFIAKIVGSAQRCEPPEGVPACNWPLYAVIGMAVGVLTLPALVLWRMTRKDAESGRR